MPTELVLTALEQALTLRQPAPGLIIHADRGSQYTSLACRTRLEKAQALARYSRPGTPYDNAQAAAGWSTLKTELLPNGGAFASLEEARLEARSRWKVKARSDWLIFFAYADFLSSGKPIYQAVNRLPPSVNEIDCWAGKQASRLWATLIAACAAVQLRADAAPALLALA
nr:hypothetical protein [Tanacetum cinerariifolium]